MMNPIWKRRIAILVSIVMVFTIACLSRLVEGISFTAFAAEPPYAEVGTATLSDEGDTVFIRMAKFNVGTEEDPIAQYCSGFTVGNMGPANDPTQNVNMDELTPIWPDAPLSGTLDKNIYICGGVDSTDADLYVNGLTLTEDHTLTAVSDFDVKMGALTVSKIIALGRTVNIGDKASVTVNGDAVVGKLSLYKPYNGTPAPGDANPADYNPQYLGGTLHVTGSLYGTQSGNILIDGGSTVIVGGDLSGFVGYASVRISNDSSLMVGGKVDVSGQIELMKSDLRAGGDVLSGMINAYQDCTVDIDGKVNVSGEIQLMKSDLRAGGDVSSSKFTAYQNCAVDIGGSLSAYDDISAMESTFSVAGSVKGSTVYLDRLSAAATVGGDLSATNLYVYGTGNAETSKTALTVNGKVTLGNYLDINKCATVTAGDVTCIYLCMEGTGPNVLNAASLRSTADISLQDKSTLNVTGDCSGGGDTFVIREDSHVNVGGNLVVNVSLDVNAGSSASVKGNVTFTYYENYQLNVYGSMTCGGDLTAKGTVSALCGTINVTGKLTSEHSPVHAIGSGSTITANEIAAASDVSAIGAPARISATGTLTAKGSGVFAIGKGSAVEAEDINATHIHALGNYKDGTSSTSGTSAIIARNDANVSQSVHTSDAGTITVGRDLNCGTDFGFSTYYDWDPKDGGWIHVGRDMRYSSLMGCISKGELTVGRDFINSATRTNSINGLAVFGGKLEVGGNVEFGSLLLNTAGNNTPLKVDGTINATRITDIIAKDGDTPLKLHTVTPFSYAETDAFGKIAYTQPWNTQYVMLADENNNSYYADVSDLTRISYSAVPATSISIACELNGQATWKNGAPCSIGYAGMSFTLPTNEDLEYEDGIHELVRWSVNADGSGDVYTPGQSVTLNEDSTFYACWDYHSVNTPAAAEGTVSAPKTALPGRPVTLTLAPAKGYTVGNVSYSYNDAAGDHVVTVKPVDGVYSFVMPKHDVTVAASWKKLMTHADISIQIQSADYTGEALSPAITVKDGQKTLTVNSDYVLGLPEGRVNAGDYTVTVSAAADSAKYSGSAAATFTIKPAGVTLTANSLSTDVYDGTAKTVTGFSSSVAGLSFASTVRASGMGVDAGEYPVTFTGVKLNATKDTTGNYVVTRTVNGKLTIDPPQSAVVLAPQGMTLIYNGSAQELVTEGEAANGTMQYALGTDARTAPSEGWSASVPAKTDGGTYYVWYKAVGWKNYSDTQPACVTAVISNSSYAVIYHANGGTGAPETQIKRYNKPLTLSIQEPTRADSAENYVTTLDPNGGTLEGPSTLYSSRTTVYSFRNWNTSPRGLGDVHVGGEEYTDNAVLYLYAQWDAESSGGKIVLPEPTREGYEFSGWNTDSSAESGVKGEITPDSSETYYAIWKANAYTISFDTAGGSEIAPITQEYGTPITAPADPTRPGYTFAGWDKAIPATMPAEDMTIKASWTSVLPEADFVLPAALITIEESAFEGIPAVRVDIPDGCESIGPRAFADCAKLTALVIPASVQSIDDTALEGSANAVIYGASGSEAERFAKDNSIPFVPMNQN